MECLNKKEINLKELMPIIIENLNNDKVIHFSPNGISMLPMLRQGKDSVILTLPVKIKKYDMPLFETSTGNYVLHRVVKFNHDGTFDCMGDNCFRAEKNIRMEQVIAVVDGFYRDDKYYSVNYVPYRIYCVIWNYTRTLRRIYRKIRVLIRRFLNAK